jgi:hypothetical protein
MPSGAGPRGTLKASQDETGIRPAGPSPWLPWSTAL